MNDQAEMAGLRGHNRLKVMGILLLFAVLLGVMVLVPSIRQSPLIDAPADAPATAP